MSLPGLSVPHCLEAVHQPLWPLSSKGQVPTVANQGKNNQEVTWCKIKRPRLIIRIRRLTTWDESKGLQTLLTPLSCQTPYLWPTFKTLIKSSGNGIHSFSRQKPDASPFAWQSSKAILCFAHISVSGIWFGTCARRDRVFITVNYLHFCLCIAVNIHNPYSLCIFGILQLLCLFFRGWTTFTNCFKPNGHKESYQENTIDSR